MNQSLSIPRRIARAVFAGLGAVSLLLVLVPFAVDKDFRGILARTDWSDPEFKAMAAGFGIWAIIAIAFLFSAFLIGMAKGWLLLVFTFANAVILAFVWKNGSTKEVVLIPLLALSLVALLVEDCQMIAKARRNTA